jgi:hypothetical protein
MPASRSAGDNLGSAVMAVQARLGDETRILRSFTHPSRAIRAAPSPAARAPLPSVPPPEELLEEPSGGLARRRSPVHDLRHLEVEIGGEPCWAIRWRPDHEPEEMARMARTRR